MYDIYVHIHMNDIMYIYIYEHFFFLHTQKLE
jgi:hypothetical protein